MSVVLDPVIEGHGVTWEVDERAKGDLPWVPPMGAGPAGRVHVGSSSIDLAPGVVEQDNLWEMRTGLQRQRVLPLPRGAGEASGVLTEASEMGVEDSPPTPPQEGDWIANGKGTSSQPVFAN